MNFHADFESLGFFKYYKIYNLSVKRDDNIFPLFRRTTTAAHRMFSVLEKGATGEEVEDVLFPESDAYDSDY